MGHMENFQEIVVRSGNWGPLRQVFVDGAKTSP
jgi:hypothetical protein